MPPSPSPSKRGYETVLDLRSSSRRCPVNRSWKHHNIKIVLNLAGLRKADVAHPRVWGEERRPFPSRRHWSGWAARSGESAENLREDDSLFWQVDRGDQLPLGLPQVMMALIRDGFTLISLKVQFTFPDFRHFWSPATYVETLSIDYYYIFGVSLWCFVQKGKG